MYRERPTVVCQECGAKVTESYTTFLLPPLVQASTRVCLDCESEVTKTLIQNLRRFSQAIIL